MSEIRENQQNLILGIFSKFDAALHVRAALGESAGIVAAHENETVRVARVPHEVPTAGYRAIGCTSIRKFFNESLILPPGNYFAATSVDSDWGGIVVGIRRSMKRCYDGLADAVLSNLGKFEKASSGLLLGSTVIAFCSAAKEQPLSFGYLPEGGIVIASQTEPLKVAEAEKIEALSPGEVVEFRHLEGRPLVFSHDIVSAG